MAYSYSASVWAAAHTAALAVITGGAGNPTIKVRDAWDVLLASATLDRANCVVSPTTGAITLAILTQEEAADASGTAVYAQLCDGNGVVHARMGCEAGTAPVTGACVINTLSIVQGGPVAFLSLTIPPGFTLP